LGGKFIGRVEQNTRKRRREIEIKELRGLKKQRRETFQQQILGQCCQLLAQLSGQSRAEIRLQGMKVGPHGSESFGVYFWLFGKVALFFEWKSIKDENKSKKFDRRFVCQFQFYFDPFELYGQNFG
jgi:hypothetical protein